MTAEEMKEAIREFLNSKDAFTSNGIANIIQAFDTIIDNIETGSGFAGIDDVLAAGQPITEQRTIDNPNHNLVFTGDIVVKGLIIDTIDGRVIMRSPNGNYWELKISDAGALVIQAN